MRDPPNDVTIRVLQNNCMKPPRAPKPAYPMVKAASNQLQSAVFDCKRDWTSPVHPSAEVATSEAVR